MKKELLEMLNTSRPCLSADEVNLYLKSELTEDQRFQIENHLLDCELCTAAVEGYSQTGEAVPTIEIKEVISRIKESGKTSTPQKGISNTPTSKVVPLRKNYNWAIAAAILVVVSIAGVLFYQNSEPDLFANYYQPYDKALLATRSGSDTENEALNLGLAAYEKGEFAESLLLLEKAKTEDPENGVIALYAGMAAMEATAYPKAANWLTEARINHQPAYATATWYLAMNYLAQKDYPSCRNMLKQLGPQDSPYYDQAQSLLQKLNE